MPTLFVSGDLFHHPGLKAFAHGCNCAGAMGKGIALEFRERLRADIQAIETALARMLAAAVATQIERIGLPRVGAGLGGLPWEEVRALPEKVGAATAIELIVFETYVPRPTA